MGTVKVGRRQFIRNTSIYSLGAVHYAMFRETNSIRRITLLGDSIRMGFQSYASLFLPAETEVWGPEENTMHSVHLLANAPQWIKNKPADIVHLNAGLHDIKNIPFDSRMKLISPEQYAENIERIIKYIHYCWPGCLVIWATTTPVDDQKARLAHEQAKDFSRYNDDVISYNEMSSRIDNKLGIPVNDLYAFVDSGDKEMIMAEDGVHFTDLGYRWLGEQVANSIRVFLE